VGIYGNWIYIVDLSNMGEIKMIEIDKDMQDMSCKGCWLEQMYSALNCRFCVRYVGLNTFTISTIDFYRKEDDEDE